MALEANLTLGRFRLIAPLGAGGMGEVWRARDERLGRDVAIKVLPAAFAADPERLARFEREARALGALSHPNILAIHDFGREGDVTYAVMELLEGQTLRDRLNRGALPMREAIPLGVQLAEGLAAAHGKGLVHRDLKPENLFLLPDGRVKILDFGLAKLVGRPLSPDQAADASTVTGATRAGVVLGTVGYMAPEQVRGQATDHRADIFALGCVLHEMLSGERAFRGDTPVDTLSAILSQEPPSLSGLGKDIPPALSQICARCLEKRPENRFSSAHDLALALQASVSGTEAVSLPPVASPRRRRWAVMAAVAAGLVAMVALGAWLLVRGEGGKAAALDPAKVLVGRFENQTGDSSLASVAAMVSESVTQGLVELGELEVVPASSDGSGTDDTALRAAARQAGAATMVSGSYFLAGAELEIRARVTDAATGKPVFVLRPERGPRGQPAPAVDRVRQRIMSALMLHLGRTPSLGGVTTPPLYSAYQEYLTGAMLMGVNWSGVVQHFERAAELDPEFWHPQIRLIFAYRVTGDRAKSEAIRQHLEENQDKLGPADRVLVQYYDAQGAGQMLEAYRKARELQALAPRDFSYTYAAAKHALDFNRPREAAEFIGDVEKYDWQFFGHWMQGTWLLGVAAFSHHLLGEHEVELKVAELGVRLYPDMLNVREDQARALAALGRIAELDRVIAESLGIHARRGTPGEVLLVAAQELRAHGHADASRRVAAQGAAWFSGMTGEQADSIEVGLNGIECLWLAERWQEARSLADATVKRYPDDHFARGYRAILAARAGDRDVAVAADRELTAADDVRGRGNYSWLRAGIAAQLGERDQAIELLRVALAHGLNAKGYLHVYAFLEPLHGYPPFEELITPKG